MAKKVCPRPASLKAKNVVDIYSVSNCVNDDFDDYIQFWEHNDYWFFNSPADLLQVAKTAELNLSIMSLFYYEIHSEQWDGETWKVFATQNSASTNVLKPKKTHLEGFDVVTFGQQTNPGCSLLSCNSMAEELPTNSHCLFSTFEQAHEALTSNAFKDCEPGPYRIFAVYSTDWPAVTDSETLA